MVKFSSDVLDVVNCFPLLLAVRHCPFIDATDRKRREKRVQCACTGLTSLMHENEYQHTEIGKLDAYKKPRSRTCHGLSQTMGTNLTSLPPSASLLRSSLLPSAFPYPQPFTSPPFRPASQPIFSFSLAMVLCSPALVWPVPVHKPVEVPSVPLPPDSFAPRLPIPSPPQPFTPSFHALSSTPPPPPLPSPNTSTTATATDQQWGQPTISTFSTSAPLHIVQPYLQNQSDPANPVKEASRLLSDALSQSAIRPRRPANAWILYRSDKMKILKPTEPSAPRRTQADISKLIAEMWKNEREEVKKYYETLSDLAKAEHHAQYPTYRFQPAKRSEKPRGQKKPRKAQLRAERGISAQRVVSSTYTSLQERSANSQLERHSIDDIPPSQRPIYSQKTVPPLPFASVFVPYEVPLRPRSFATSETKRSTRSQSSEESQVLPSPLPSLVTTLSMSPTTPLIPSEAVSSEPSTRFLHRWPEQSTPLTTTIQYNAHSDHSHAYNSPITVCLVYSAPITGHSLTNPFTDRP